MNTLPHQQHDVNVVVMTDAGKLIFSRFDNTDDEEEDLSSFCGFVQAIRGTMLNDPNLNHGDIQFINANNSKMYFMHVGCITLVAIARKERSNNENNEEQDTISKNNYNNEMTQQSIIIGEDGCNGSNNDYYTEAILRMHLEYVYTGIIFTLTNSVQSELEHNPNLDVREVLGSSVRVLRNVLDDSLNLDDGDQTCLFLGGIDVFGPIPNEIRNYTSQILCKTCSQSKSIIYAILSIHKQLFTIIQPHSKQYQLQPFDINLLLHFINSQTQTMYHNLWYPICLPTLSQSGFVHGYQCCIGVEELKLTIISQDRSIEEFERLKHIANDIKLEFGFMEESNEENILRIYNLDHHRRSVVGKKSQSKEDVISDDHLIWERTKIVVNHNDGEIEQRKSKPTSEKKRYGYYLLRCIKKSLDPAYQKQIIQTYCEMASLIHFVFRYSAPIRNFESGSMSSGGNLVQCYNSSMKFIDEDVSKKLIWSTYQKLSLRLRIGSASSQSTIKEMEAIQTAFNTNNERNEAIQCDWRPSQTLLKLGVKDGGVLFIVHEDLLFLVISAKDNEFYATLPATTMPSDAITLCGALVDTLLNDTKDILHSKPLSF